MSNDHPLKHHRGPSTHHQSWLRSSDSLWTGNFAAHWMSAKNIRMHNEEWHQCRTQIISACSSMKTLASPIDNVVSSRHRDLLESTVNRWSSVHSPIHGRNAGPRFWKLESSRCQVVLSWMNTGWRGKRGGVNNCLLAKHCRSHGNFCVGASLEVWGIEDEGQSIRVDLLYPSIANCCSPGSSAARICSCHLGPTP
ncbi:hypothetical protein FIBSPDRAFT_587310 [Athelia psychrophila]|uniref:Uncharacterized protein n=1 Tax=Athelia psychrophila TaxID=1759441 RepID=A0A166HCQ1_9AGAM|nr:hypothetical protein FIBSPDRAFT_587310 [Fibularhizoctonia sp. CBS 109695]